MKLSELKNWKCLNKFKYYTKRLKKNLESNSRRIPGEQKMYRCSRVTLVTPVIGETDQPTPPRTRLTDERETCPRRQHVVKNK